MAEVQLSPNRFDKSSRAARCFSSIFSGTVIFTVTKRSPVDFPIVIPSPFTLKVLPVWVPDGSRSFLVPLGYLGI